VIHMSYYIITWIIEDFFLFIKYTHNLVHEINLSANKSFVMYRKRYLFISLSILSHYVYIRILTILK